MLTVVGLALPDVPKQKPFFCGGVSSVDWYQPLTSCQDCLTALMLTLIATLRLLQAGRWKGVEGEVEGGGRGGGGVQVQPRKRMRWSANGGIITHLWGSGVGGACYAPM